MAEFNHKEDFIEVEPTNVMTGGYDRSRYLLYQLKMSIRTAESIDIMVSFLMESGIKMILKDLADALDRGVKIRILTGNYLGITQPSALYLVKEKLGTQVELKFFNESRRSFHPKAYIFHYREKSEIYIGSSNLSRSALTSGIEWNYRFTSKTDPHAYGEFFSQFEELYNHHSILIDDKELKRYSKSWHKPSVYRDLERYDEEPETLQVHDVFEPRGAQIEALYALRNSREEGADKGLVHAATGIGKTYLAAFDSKEYERVLFVAHREEILKQAAESFRNVRKSEEYGFFDRNEKCTDKPAIFASVFTLGRSEYLDKKYFAPDYFDYIVIDEFHHAVTDQYQRIVNYFKPKFMLGLTATPERMDGKNIYELCDYNVPYEITLKEAIDKGMLVPFHYYGIYDDTDYSKLHVVRGKYDDKELNEIYIGNVHRHDLILKYYHKYRSDRALGFCCYRAHAEEMAKVFSSHGVPSVAVYSGADGEYSEDREAAIRKLKTGEIKVIFSVDMFNEGVDIPNIDMVMFLRPTESPTVFLQQLGRGLRKYRGKEYLNVLDFIGNYEKAGNVRYFLGEYAGTGESGSSTKVEYPEECLIDFDMRLVDLFNELDHRSLSIQEKIRKEYFRVKQEVEHVPSRVELFTYMDDDIYNLCLTHAKENPFKKYLEFLKGLNELNEDEEILYTGIGREFLNLIENTNMQKVYKMPVLMAFYNEGNIRMAVTEEELFAKWKEFFGKGVNWKDLKTDITYEGYKRISDKAHLRNIMNNPVHFLMKSGKGFFVEKDGYAIALRDELKDVIGSGAFIGQMKDIIEYRTLDYYRRRYKERL